MIVLVPTVHPASKDFEITLFYLTTSNRLTFSITVARLGLTFFDPDLHCHVYPLASSWLPNRSFDGLRTRVRCSLLAPFGPSPVSARPRSWSDFIAQLLRTLNLTPRPFIIRTRHVVQRFVPRGRVVLLLAMCQRSNMSV